MKKMSMKMMKTLFISYFFLTLSFGGVVVSKSMMVMDKMGFFMLVMTILVSLISVMSKKDIFLSLNKLFLVLVVLIFLSVEFFFCSINLFWFFFFFEMSVLPMFILVGGWGYQLERIQAGYYLIMYTSFFSFPFMVFFMVIASKVSLMMMSKMSMVGSFMISGVMMGIFLVKTPIYFLHLWLPKAHVESPVMGSIMLAGILLKLGGLGVYRVMNIFEMNKKWVSLLLMVFFLGAFMACMVSFMQSDQKSLIAYASVGHMTILIFCFYSFFLGVEKSGLLLMFVHALVSSFLFFFSYMFYTESMNRLVVLNQGLMMKMSMFFFVFFIFMLMNFSVPPFPSFFSEILIMESLMKMSNSMVLIVFLVVMGGCCYSIFLMINSFHGKLVWEKKVVEKPMSVEISVQFLLVLILMIFTMSTLM